MPNKKSPLMKLIKERRSIRMYNPDKEISEKDILSVIEAARFAPSACNSQPWRFIIVRDQEKRERFVKECLGGIVPNKFALHAPVIIVMAADMKIHRARIGEKLKNIDYHQIDLGIAGEHLVLRAQELGLGTCWLGWFNVKKVSALIDLPKRVRPVSLFTLGYPAKKTDTVKSRLSVKDILFFDTWGNTTS
jgi:nitroreductase